MPEMTTGLVLIAAILLLGGVIATVGDRIGMRVGKSRLSLFKLRPRQTATLITILTGIIISAATFGVLFAVSDQLRTGVFELEQIQEDLDEARTGLEEAQAERQRIETELSTAIRQRLQARRQLRDLNRSLAQVTRQKQQGERQLRQNQAQLQATQQALMETEVRFRQAQQSLQQVSQQVGQLRGEIDQLQQDRETAIAERDRAIAEKEQELSQLEAQQRQLTQELAVLEREVQGLRLGNVALFRNQPLASNLIRVVNPSTARQAVIEVLQDANTFAIQRIRPGTVEVDQQVLAVTTNQVEQLASRLSDGDEYVVQILSGGNYFVGEPCVLAGEACIRVLISSTPNELLFSRNAVLASVTLTPSTLAGNELAEQINLLIGTAQFRMRQAGVVAEVLQIADGRNETVLAFFRALGTYQDPIDIQVQAASTIYSAGPVRLKLAAIQNGQELFSTESILDEQQE